MFSRRFSDVGSQCMLSGLFWFDAQPRSAAFRVDWRFQNALLVRDRHRLEMVQTSTRRLRGLGSSGRHRTDASTISRLRIPKTSVEHCIVWTGKTQLCQHVTTDNITGMRSGKLLETSTSVTGLSASKHQTDIHLTLTPSAGYHIY